MGFLEDCFKQGLLDKLDAVSVHPYRPQAPETVIPVSCMALGVALIKKGGLLCAWWFCLQENNGEDKEKKSNASSARDRTLLQYARGVGKLQEERPEVPCCV